MRWSVGSVVIAGIFCGCAVAEVTLESYESVKGAEDERDDDAYAIAAEVVRGKLASLSDASGVGSQGDLPPEVELVSSDGLHAWIPVSSTKVRPGAEGPEQHGKKLPLPHLHISRGALSQIEARGLVDSACSGDLFNRDADSVDGKPTDEIPILRDGEEVRSLARKAGGEVLLQHARLIFDRLLPRLQETLSCSTCVICTSLLRRYSPELTRASLEFHSDEHAFATAVISLSVAEDYQGGLIVETEGSMRTRRLVRLEEGDMVTHRYDLWHGVDVRKGTRFSLVMWVKEHMQDCTSKTTPWKLRSAEGGDAVAQYLVAREYIFGNQPGGKKQGWPWLRRSAEQGIGRAQVNIGNKDASDGDILAARGWWRRAAAQGIAQAMYNIGLSYQDGSTEPDVHRSMRWLRLASEEGDADASEKLDGCLTYRPPCAA